MPEWTIDPGTLCPDCLAATWRSTACGACDYDGDHGQTAEFLPPRVILNNKYFVGLMLGQEGGFGVTYRAVDLTSGAHVAIKEYFPSQLSGRLSGSRDVRPRDARRAEYFEKGLAQFEKEAKLLGEFGHHHAIVDVIDFFRQNGTAYFVMPYLQGVTLQQYVDNINRNVPYALATQLLMPVVDALRHAHKLKVLHRDVSPENIYIKRDDRQVILLDFGAARSPDALRLTQLLKVGFTPREINHGLKQGEYSDVYSVAATLYYILTNTLVPSPEAREDGARLFPPSELGSDIKPAAERVLLKALAVHGADRHQTMLEFRDELLAADEEDAAADASRAAEPAGDASGSVETLFSPLASRPAAAQSPNWPVFGTVLILLAFVMAAVFVFSR